MDRFVLVHSTPTAAEGHLARGCLEAEGIPVLVKGEGDGPYRTGPVDLWVPVERQAQARMVLAEAATGGLALED